MLAFVTSRVGKILGAVALAASILLGAFVYGRQTEARSQRVENLEAYIETAKEIQDVEASPDRDAALERLQRNGWTR